MSNGAADEFDAFYGARASTLVRAIYLRTGDMTRAQDCVQEAFTRAWLKWPTLQTGPDPVAWVRTVAWNLAVTDWRSRRRARGRDEQWRVASAAQAPPVAEVIAVREALRHLPRHQQTAIILHYFEDMSIVEIAEMTGKPAGTIKSNLHRARLTLREQLGDADSAPDATRKAGTS
jgi:RNA polymerase sigma-70 factor (ECF subfamily)